MDTESWLCFMVLTMTGFKFQLSVLMLSLPAYSKFLKGRDPSLLIWETSHVLRNLCNLESDYFNVFLLRGTWQWLLVSTGLCTKIVTFLTCEMNLDTYISWYFMLTLKEQCFCFSVVTWCKIHQRITNGKIYLTYQCKVNTSKSRLFLQNFSHKNIMEK